MPKINSLEVVHQDTNADPYQNLHDLLVDLNKSLALNKEVVDGDARASIENLLEMYVNDKEAFLRSLQTLTAQFKASEAKYEEEILLQASAIQALAKRTSTLTAQTANSVASVTEYAEAVASEVALKISTYRQDEPPTGTLAYGDLWYDTNNNNKVYRWNGIVWVDTTRIPTFSQDTAPTNPVSGDIWMDTNDNNRTYRWDGSSWVDVDNGGATAYARWGVQVNANGHVAGIQLNSDSTGTSEFTVLANTFYVYNGSTIIPAFRVSGGQVYINEDLTVSGDIISGGTITGVAIQITNVMNTNQAGAYLAITNIRSNSIRSSSVNTKPIGDAIITSDPTIRNKIDGSLEVGANITAWGTITPFTGSHRGVVTETTTFRQGAIVVDGAKYDDGDISNTRYYTVEASIPNQRGVVGVYNQDYYEQYENIDGTYTIVNPLSDGNKIILFNSVGEGKVLVNGQNGNLQRGDLVVTSSTAGEGMKQADDIIRSYTVAKVREDVTFSSPTEVKLVPCIYLCG